MFKLQHLTMSVLSLVGLVALALGGAVYATDLQPQQSHFMDISPNHSIDQSHVIETNEIPAGLSDSDWEGIQTQIVASLTAAPIFEQQAYLKASNTDLGDEFGWSTAISGDTLVVGTYLESSNATGVNGDQTNDLAMSSGAAYVFTHTAGVWSQQAYLKASNTQSDDEFGLSVAISGDTLVIGAHREDSNATGVNGDQNNDLASKSGAAYVFTRTGSVWSQQAYLKASNTNAYDVFGTSVAISGDTLVVGAVNEGSNATGVNGDQADDSTWDSGAAYVFTRTDGVWSQQAYLKASNTDFSDYFGWSVAISGETLVVGARGEDSNATGVDGDQANNLASYAGAAYVFTRTDGVWSQQAYLKASNTGAEDRFGESLSISGDRLVIGAYWEDSNATGVDGDGADNSAEGSGAAYVFTREDGVWDQQAYLKASNTRESDEFGRSVAISGLMLVIGARGEDSNATGIDGDITDYFSSASGAAYIFTPAAGAWGQRAYLKASNAETRDEFGRSVAISGHTLIVGAIGEDSGATGVDGEQADNSILSSGALYVINYDDVIFADSFEDKL